MISKIGAALGDIVAGYRDRDNERCVSGLIAATNEVRLLREENERLRERIKELQEPHIVGGLLRRRGYTVVPRWALEVLMSDTVTMPQPPHKQRAFDAINYALGPSLSKLDR